MSQVLHIDLVALVPDAPPDARQGLIASAAGLVALSGVVSGGAIVAEAGSDYDLALLFVLEGFTELEAFGTDGRYAEYLQHHVAPVLRSLAGADVQLENDFGGIDAAAACLALAAPDETFDWEVREALASWMELVPSRSAGVVGLAVGERQRFRGLALAFAPEVSGARAPDALEYGVTYLRGAAVKLA